MLKKELNLTNEEVAVFESIMPGGETWHKEGQCLESCPFYEGCKNAGPDSLCSDEWKKVEVSPIVSDVLFHIFSNFDSYDMGDLGEELCLSEDVKNILNKIRKLEGDDSLAEGEIRSRTHNYRERKSAISRKLKINAYKNNKLICAACDHDGNKYEEKAALRIIECHHTVPISSDKHTGKTKKSDLILLCANCHRLDHSEKEPLNVEGIRKILSH
ncbi:HNH endonuclease [Endozoicomonas sp. 4G]|uniref:HNH endonuclease n=1 Tax=Endozoicomonas sp. 4G TaxID=2872754 RepID=UPI002078C6FA|nr:HNH endonuclease [Endozoicomonas sp. 4G]